MQAQDVPLLVQEAVLRVSLEHHYARWIAHHIVQSQADPCELGEGHLDGNYLRKLGVVPVLHIQGRDGRHRPHRLQPL